jgi:sterol 3beta-glucosyltransferase
MRITILTAGSRGDIQPYLALALGLKCSGHCVKLASHINFKDWIETYGIEFAELSGNPREMTANGESSKWVDSGRNLGKYVSNFKQVLVPMITQMMCDIWGAAQGADLLLPSMLCSYPSYIVSREQKIPWIQTFLQPHHPTRAFPSALIPTHRNYGNLGNLISHYMGGLLLWNVMRPAFNEVLENEFHLEPFRREGIFAEVEKAEIPSLYAFSPTLISKPRDWSQHLHVTGYWFLREAEGWTPPRHLSDFLSAGPAPVYVGFGSMPINNPAKTTQIVIEALQKAGQRGIIHTGWGGLHQDNIPDNIIMIDNAPHDWLFPRMAAVVHHGGAGTTAAGLRAGKPSIVVPFFADQPWWGMRIHERGVGPKPIHFEKLTTDNLASAIRQAVNDPKIRQRAGYVGERIQAEDGVGCALSIIHEYMEMQ